jgi:3-isopropylmalate/(R)-2-methylmalate dehydratase large subunit
VTDAPRTLFDKIWQRHVVADLTDGFYLVFVDRHLLNDLAARGFLTLEKRGLAVRHPELTFATADHTVATLATADPQREGVDNPYVKNLRASTEKHGITLFDVGSETHGIIHVIAAEQGLAYPGLTVTCGDSHVSTLGALGCITWGIGQSELVHVLATQTSVQRKPKTMRLNIEGPAPADVTAKDVILHVIGQVGIAGAAGHAVEFAGSAVRAMTMEERFTLCNMAIELGARYGLVAPDETTIAYLRDRPFAPTGADWDAALADWRTLTSDPDAVFDREVTVDVSRIEPQVTWGTTPEQVVGIGGAVPMLDAADVERAAMQARALDYVGLASGQTLKGIPIDRVFIGSCTNSRISDLRAAASVARGRHVAPHVEAWVVPGSAGIKRQAEEEGLDRIFTDAGFRWGSPGCSMCAASGDQMRELAAPGARVVSTTNRNFVGRQGPGSRTHLASPATAAASAIAGAIAGVRDLEPRHG